MLKNLIALFLFISSISIAQNTVQGYLSPNLKSDWLILYKIEGTEQVFINNILETIYHKNKNKPLGPAKFQISIFLTKATNDLTLRSWI
jgi:hypothetical protein